MASETTLKRFQRILDTLDMAPRAAFLLHRVDGLAYDQIAWRLGISLAAVEQHLADALYELSLSDEDDDPG